MVGLAFAVWARPYSLGWHPARQSSEMGFSRGLGLLHNSILTMESKEFSGFERTMCCDRLAVDPVIRDCRLLG